MYTVEEIVEALRVLPHEKQAEVWRRVYFFWLPVKTTSQSGADDSVRQLYYWLSSNFAHPKKRSSPRRPPINVKGKPISETVIEDRR